MSYVKIGVGGPVGSGKTALIERLTRIMSKEYSICVITNDIYTKEDAEFLIKNSALPPERIVGVETAKDMVNVWLNTEFEGGRHQRRVDLIMKIEEE